MPITVMLEVISVATTRAFLREPWIFALQLDCVDFAVLRTAQRQRDIDEHGKGVWVEG